MGMIGRQAVVIGAGMGGLTAARALADFFDQVVVLERDSLPSQPATRAGIPELVHAMFKIGKPAPEPAEKAT